MPRILYPNRPAARWPYSRPMSRLSTFYGISLSMYYDKHGIPHFHAEYAGARASIAIGSLAVLGGALPFGRNAWWRSGRPSIKRSSRRTGRRPATSLRWNPSRRCRRMLAMAELVHVTAVEVVGDHRLRLSFEDGVVAVIDFAGRKWRGVFEPLRDPRYFARLSLDEQLGTIVWPNGADIAPETLHAEAQRNPIRAA